MRVAVVLAQHAVDIENAYGAFRLAARRVGTRLAASKNGLVTSGMRRF